VVITDSVVQIPLITKMMSVPGGVWNMWDTPFDESMLKDPRGVLVLCNCISDAVELEKILNNNGINDFPGTLEERYDMCIKRYQDEGVCFSILDKRISEDADGRDSSVGYCYCSYYERDEFFGSYIKCTFYGKDEPTFESASDSEMCCFLGF